MNGQQEQEQKIGWTGAVASLPSGSRGTSGATVETPVETPVKPPVATPAAQVDRA